MLICKRCGMPDDGPTINRCFCEPEPNAPKTLLFLNGKEVGFATSFSFQTVFEDESIILEELFLSKPAVMMGFNYTSSSESATCVC